MHSALHRGNPYLYALTCMINNFDNHPYQKCPAELPNSQKQYPDAVTATCHYWRTNSQRFCVTNASKFCKQSRRTRERPKADSFRAGRPDAIRQAWVHTATQVDTCLYAKEHTTHPFEYSFCVCRRRRACSALCIASMRAVVATAITNEHRSGVVPCTAHKRNIFLISLAHMIMYIDIDHMYLVSEQTPLRVASGMVLAALQ